MEPSFQSSFRFLCDLSKPQVKLSKPIEFILEICPLMFTCLLISHYFGLAQYGEFENHTLGNEEFP